MSVFTAVYTFRGITKEQFDEFIAAIGVKTALPDGMKFFLGGASSDGQTVVFYWSSPNFIPYDDWMLMKFQPAYQRLKLPAPIPATFQPRYSFGSVPKG